MIKRSSKNKNKPGYGSKSYSGLWSAHWSQTPCKSYKMLDSWPWSRTGKESFGWSLFKSKSGLLLQSWSKIK